MHEGDTKIILRDKACKGLRQSALMLLPVIDDEAVRVLAG